MLPSTTELWDRCAAQYLKHGMRLSEQALTLRLTLDTALGRSMGPEAPALLYQPDASEDAGWVVEWEAPLWLDMLPEDRWDRVVASLGLIDATAVDVTTALRSNPTMNREYVRYSTQQFYHRLVNTTDLLKRYQQRVQSPVYRPSLFPAPFHPETTP